MESTIHRHLVQVPAGRMSGCARSRPHLGLVMFALCTVLLLVGGCSSKKYLMPTPSIYTQPDWNPFADVPPALRGDTASVLYITDRVPETATPKPLAYGHRRSRSAAFGEAVVRFGNGLSWDDIVAASRTEKRSDEVELNLVSTTELARFAKTPPTLVLTDAQLAAFVRAEADSTQLEAEKRFREDMAARLAKTPRKEVFIYVHGFANSFENAALTTAEIWHFLGREGVPVCYTWPAGDSGFKAYQYTLESTQFTVYHFKQALRLIASCPEVEKVHIIAHSRGTAVTTDTIRELHLEIRGTADTQQTLKLGTVILAAADIDLDVAIARDATERIGRAMERSAIYIASHDKALGVSGWLFGGIRRLGDIDPKIFDTSEIEALRSSQRLQLIDARIKKAGLIGHSYFHNNPAVSSDLVLMMRYQLPPGAGHGRPLGASELGLWVIDDDYPGPAWVMPHKAQ